jgi:hypothetical protein
MTYVPFVPKSSFNTPLYPMNDIESILNKSRRIQEHLIVLQDLQMILVIDPWFHLPICDSLCLLIRLSVEWRDVT